MHYRKVPKEHKFTHNIFMFYLDLDEIDDIAKKVPLISRNRFNIYNFEDHDHIELGGANVKENVIKYLFDQGIDFKDGKIMLLTNLKTFGYNFNPVSFYFCFNSSGEPICVVPEIGNTFRELKPFILKSDALDRGRFKSQQVKHYYISPFMNLDIPLDFNIGIPNERLDIRIDDLNKDGEKFFWASMTGKKHELNFKNLLKYSILFPLVTLKVIALIHLHALWLWLKKVPHHEKEVNPHLQKGVYRAWSKEKSVSKNH